MCINRCDGIMEENVKDIKYKEVLNLTSENAIRNILVNSLGLDKYKKIMKDIKNKSLKIYDESSKEKNEFQKNYNAFYKVRCKSERWYKKYYELFQKLKNEYDNKNYENINFPNILDELYKIENTVDASFASKMLATFKPKMPIWDQYVLKNLGLELNGKGNDRKENAKKVYKDIIKKTNKLLKDPNIKELLKIFDTYVGDYHLEPMKKLDFILWSKR